MASSREPVYDEDDANCNESFANCTQLGFVEKRVNILFDNPNWAGWDGGKVGGKPVWLNPVDIPSTESLQCKFCHDPMNFLLQIYCPLDDIEDAFHRCLYLFCCRKRSCSLQHSVVCFRSQLPKVNLFYSAEPSAGNSNLNAPVGPVLCQVCGCFASKKCSACGKVGYCSKMHQKIDWKKHKLSCSSSSTIGDCTVIEHDISVITSANNIRSDDILWPEFDLVVEAEEAENGEDLDDESFTPDRRSARAAIEAGIVGAGDTSDSTHIWEDAVTAGGAEEEEDAKLTQTDYNRAMGNKEHDPVYVSFLTRIARPHCAGQVLRYCRWAAADADNDGDDGVADVESLSRIAGNLASGALLISGTSNTKQKWGSVPPCQCCGAQRAFEFQVMPQLLHYLNVDANTTAVLVPATAGPSENSAKDDGPGSAVAGTTGVISNRYDKDIEWGTLDVFTCTASCSTPGQAWFREEVVVQPQHE